MSLTSSFRLVSPEQVKYVNELMAKISKRYPDCNKKGEALIKLLELYETSFTESVYRDIPPSVIETINEVECSYLKYDGETLGFFCYEKFHINKKGLPVGISHDKVISRCNLCRLGKFDKEQSKIQEQLRKKNIKGILDLRDILIKLTHESTLAQIYICRGKLFDHHELIISADGIHLKCPLQLDDKGKEMDMSVIEHCYEQINPMEMNPPCQYLIDPHVRVRPPDRAEEIIEELKQIEHKPQEKTVHDEPTIIDAEIIESDEEKQEDEENE